MTGDAVTSAVVPVRAALSCRTLSLISSSGTIRTLMNLVTGGLGLLVAGVAAGCARVLTEIASVKASTTKRVLIEAMKAIGDEEQDGIKLLLAIIRQVGGNSYRNIM